MTELTAPFLLVRYTPWGCTFTLPSWVNGLNITTCGWRAVDFDD